MVYPDCCCLKVGYMDHPDCCLKVGYMVHPDCCLKVGYMVYPDCCCLMPDIPTVVLVNSAYLYTHVLSSQVCPSPADM